MRLQSIQFALVCTTIVSSIACSGSTTSPSSTTTTPTGNVTNEVVTGTVAAPVNSVLQSAANPFTVAQSNGTLSVTLTSAVETLPDGSLLSAVTMGLGVGTWSNGVCTLMPNTFVTAQGGSAAQLSGTINSGAYCVQISDVTGQLGPVAYAVALSHY